jgi:hypothetical protein
MGRLPAEPFAGRRAVGPPAAGHETLSRLLAEGLGAAPKGGWPLAAAQLRASGRRPVYSRPSAALVPEGVSGSRRDQTRARQRLLDGQKSRFMPVTYQAPAMLASSKPISACPGLTPVLCAVMSESSVVPAMWTWLPLALAFAALT